MHNRVLAPELRRDVLVVALAVLVMTTEHLINQPTEDFVGVEVGCSNVFRSPRVLCVVTLYILNRRDGFLQIPK